MALPNFNPATQTSRSVLPSTGSASDVASSLAFAIYSSNTDFVTGSVEQVSYVYSKLGGDILDVELSPAQVYKSYEESCLEYSYLVNIHQAKNALPSALGTATASFDDHGELISGSSVNMKYPQFTFGYARQVSRAASQEVGIGGYGSIYSASIQIVDGRQNYDLQAMIKDLSDAGGVPYANLVTDKRINIRRVYYKSARSTWRFYGYYGGLNTVGNLSTYGQFADDSTFEVIPTWQNKLQAMAYEDSIYTRVSHYSYELRNNTVRLYPIPYVSHLRKLWVEFEIPMGPFEEKSDRKYGADGVNNINNFPVNNIPYNTINSIGKQWIRRYSLSLCKEMLGYVRGKFASIPIPNNDLQMNGSDLISQAKEEQEKLREELKTVLDELTYAKMVEQQAAMAENSKTMLDKIPLLIYVG